jgi:HPr kinase/phosphorylase
MLFGVNSEPGAATVAALLDHGELGSSVRVHSGQAGLERLITHPRIQKSGLAFAGHHHGIVPTRVQIIGETEFSFLEGLDDSTRDQRIAAFFDLGLSAVVVTRGVAPLKELVFHAKRTSSPLLTSEVRSSRTIAAIHRCLDDLLAASTTSHGVLVDIHGVGVLLLGPSGIGKSECALFLVERGHRLVADDQVILAIDPAGHVYGRPPPLLRYHLEVRGIGILNIRDLFGATAVRRRKIVDLVVELCPWDSDEPYDRLGLEDMSYELLGTELPMLRIPVSPGRDMGVILEVAARNHLLKQSGNHAARRFVSELSEELGAEPPPETDGGPDE